MTVEDLLRRLTGVKTIATGIKALCPAHHDRNPSLSIKVADDGRILLHCWAGCRNEDIVAALGIRFADLFPETLPSALPKQTHRLPVYRPDKVAIAFLLKLHSDCLGIRAESTLNAASGLDCSDWTAGDYSSAIGIVERAYAELERADSLYRTACHIRMKDLERKGASIAA